MERAHRWFALVPFGRVSTRIREVSRNPAHRRRAQGLALLLTSLIFGLWANEAAQKLATRRWLKAHPPTPHVWRHALESRGYRLLQKPGALHRALRSLPSQADDLHAAWADPQGEWVAIFERESDRLIPWLYCLECGPPPSTWQRLGTGWEAFEGALPLCDQALKRRQTLPKPQKTSPARDPRQIDY